MTSQSELTNNRLQSALRPGAAKLSLSLITSTDLAEDQSPAGPSAFTTPLTEKQFQFLRFSLHLFPVQ